MTETGSPKTATDTIPNLPIGAVTREAYRLFWSNQGRFWKLVFWPGTIISVSIFASLFTATRPLLALALNLVDTGAFALFFFAWFRTVLLDSDSETTLPFLWSPTHTAIFGYQLAIALACGLVAYPFNLLIGFMSVDEPGSLSFAVFVAVTAAVVFIFAYLGGRLALVLPMRTILRQARFADAWMVSQGAGLRIVAVLALTVVPVAVVAVALADQTIALARNLEDPTRPDYLFTIGISDVVGSAAYAIAYLIIYGMAAVVFTVIFRRLSGWQPPIDERTLKAFE